MYGTQCKRNKQAVIVCSKRILTCVILYGINIPKKDCLQTHRYSRRRRRRRRRRKRERERERRKRERDRRKKRMRRR
jgi:hypothetical protein